MPALLTMVPLPIRACLPLEWPASVVNIRFHRVYHL